MNALPKDARWVLVHDGARPCVSLRLIERVVRVGKRYGAAVAALPAHLTVKEADRSGRVRRTLDRRRLWFIQTPQVFRRAWLAQGLQASARRLAAFPDDAAAVEAAGFSVRLVPGEPLNVKVTTSDDLIPAAAALARRR